MTDWLFEFSTMDASEGAIARMRVLHNQLHGGAGAAVKDAGMDVVVVGGGLYLVARFNRSHGVDCCLSAIHVSCIHECTKLNATAAWCQRRVPVEHVHAHSSLDRSRRSTIV
jgi:hypothetical protein